MSHQGQGRSADRPAVFAALNWLVKPQAFGRLSFRQECRWTPASLVKATLVWAWSEEASRVDRFVSAQEVIRLGDDKQRESVSYQAFIKLLQRHPAVLLAAVVATLQRAVRESLGNCDRVAGCLAFTVDGTRRRRKRPCRRRR